MPSKYWIKLYHEILHDPKMARLPDRLWRRAIELFLMAGETGDGGELPDIADMAWTLRVELSDLVDDLAELAKIGVLTETPDGWVVTKFAVRQAATSDAKRMAQWRERNRKAQYEGDASVTELVTNRNAEPDIDTEADAEVEADAEETAPPAFSDVVKAYNSAGGMISERTGELLGEMCDTYAGRQGHTGEQWVVAAIEEGAKSSKGPPTVNFLDAICKRWERDGFQAPFRKDAKWQNGQRNTEVDHRAALLRELALTSG